MTETRTATLPATGTFATPAAGINSYDEVPYDSHPFAQSHPDRLATVAKLFGLRTPPLESARVLELGCAAGGNILPFALDNPNSKVIGIDLAARQINDGQKLINALGVKNIELKHASILDVDASYGEFDYIICHGVYSWVPSAVQEKIMRIAQEQLAQNGVLYISYNTYPGWHMRGMIRDMMRYHVQRFLGPTVRVRQARSLLDFLQQSVKQESSAYGVLLKQEVETIRKQADHYLYHEHLEEVNEPLYFHQFMDRANNHDLQYLGEARVGVMVTSNFGPEVEKTLKMLANDLVQMEQYMDFLRNRMFRETLLCRKRVPLERTLTPEVVKGLNISSSARPTNPTIDLQGATSESFQSPSGMNMSTTLPLLKATMLSLQEMWPSSVPFEQLRLRAYEKLGKPAPLDPQQTAQDLHLIGMGLLNCYLGSDLVEFRTAAPQFVTKPGDKPTVSQLNREQLKISRMITNRRHEVVNLNDFEYHLVSRLDGNHDRAALANAMTELANKNVITIQEKGEVIKDANRLREASGILVEHSLANLARQALLLA
jgi:methyltransferase-like protein/2-polyprenyl-3-methyl-5-hydroxy-6-metoxy-1,4-benzoquinol methylase